VDDRPADELAWHSGRQCDGGACVEAAGVDEGVLVRSSLVPGATLRLSRDEWHEFLVAAKAGHFDAV
jgi:hypothetical protein